MLKKKSEGMVVWFCAVLLLFSGCASGTDKDLDSSGTSTLESELPSALGCPDATYPGSLGVIPEFFGPYAYEFADLFCYPDAEIVREIVRDGVLSPVEMDEMNALQKSCLEGLGFFDVEVYGDGRLNASYPEGSRSESEVEELIGRCEVETGWGRLVPLFIGVRTDPDKQGADVMIAACMVRGGMREPGYTNDDYMRESEDGTLESVLSDTSHEFYQVFLDCILDPQSVQ